MAADQSDRPSGEFMAGVGVTLLVVWFIAYNFFGFRIQGIATGEFFPSRTTLPPAESGAGGLSTGTDSGPVDGTRRDAIDALVSACTSERGSPSACECVATFLVDNTSRDEMVFAEEPPSTGKWIYFAGDMWVPAKYRSAFAECGP